MVSSYEVQKPSAMASAEILAPAAEQAPASHAPPPLPAPPRPAPPRAPVGPPRRGPPAQHRGPPGGGGLLGRLLRLPMAALRSGTGLLFNALSFGASLAGALGARLLPAPVLNVLRGARRLEPSSRIKTG